MRYDVAIIGGGPAGYTAAEVAAKNGLTVILFEKDQLGGVCLNEGCIPTKTFLYSAKLYDQTKTAAKYGITYSGTATPEMPKIAKRKKRVVRKLVLGIKNRLQEAGVTIISGEATIISKHKINCNNEIYRCNKMIACTGSSTVIPPIPGLSETPYWTHREALEITEIPTSITIIGGGVIGMEFASFFNSIGCQVTVVEMMNHIVPSMDHAISDMLQETYSKRGIDFKLGHKVTEVTMDNELFVIQTEDPDGTKETIRKEKLLVCVGRRPNTEGIGLENLKLDRDDQGQVIVDQRMRTSSSHLYLCGDANHKMMLAHTAVREAEIAVRNILKHSDYISYPLIPQVLYTNPECACVGATEQELIHNKTAYITKELPMTYSGRFVAENEGETGLCRLYICPTTDNILGVHLLGNPASELIVQASMAMHMGLKARHWQRFVFPHPTVSEIFKECLSINASSNNEDPLMDAIINN